MIEIAVLHHTGQENRTAALSEFLGIDTVEDPSGANFLIAYDEQNRLGIRAVSAGGNPVFVEIRPLRQSKGKDPLMRAIGYKTRTVFDATAGWATDAMHIASHKIAVTACERNAVIFALVADGLERCEDAGIKRHLHLWHGNSLESLQQITEQPEVIYLDPMYPAKTGNASPKKPLQILQSLYRIERYREMDVDNNELNLLTLARQVAQRRVVVKRPHHAPPIEPGPAGAVHGKLVRFDIYSPIAS